MYLNKKTIIVTMLSILIPLMAVGYAILNQTLVINGTSHIDSNWQVEIIGITESDVVGDATDKVAPSYSATTARFRVSLINPTDSITYNIKIKNLGTLDARIKKINIDTGTSDAIEYEVKCKIDQGEYQVCDESHFKNQVLEPNKEQMVKIKVSFKEGYIGQPSNENSTSTVKVVIDYVQNFKDSNGNQILPYKAYSIGDKITYKDADWYVIEDSGANKDYVVLLKENALATAEIGDAYSYKNKYGVAGLTMPYYWNSTCHYSVTYGTDTYSSDDVSGCNGHSDYAESKIKQAVDNYMINNLDESQLKVVDNYKIRLITLDELIENLDFTYFTYYSTDRYEKSSTTPSWAYNVHYWTMTSYSANYVWHVHSDGIVRYTYSGYTICGSVSGYGLYSVRPVINLYKSAIE